MAYLISNPRFIIWNISYITSRDKGDENQKLSCITKNIGFAIKYRIYSNKRRPRLSAALE